MNHQGQKPDVKVGFHKQIEQMLRTKCLFLHVLIAFHHGNKASNLTLSGAPGAIQGEVWCCISMVNSYQHM